MKVRFPGLPLLAAALLALAACSSPNRGVWEGTFDGSVAGTVRFEINARGTRLTGTMEGETRRRQPFTAELQGRLRDVHFYATLEGKARTGLLPVGFTGLMRGELGDGRAAGDWTAELKPRSTGVLEGSWRAVQVADGAGARRHGRPARR